MRQIAEMAVSTRLAIFDKCNFRCVYCGGQNNSFLGSMENYRGSVDAPVLDTPSLIQTTLALGEYGLRAFRLTGGEPTLRKDWDNVANTLADADREVDVTTNMSTMRRFLDTHGDRLPKLKTIKVSFDAADSEVFRQMTGGRGNIKEIEKQIARLTKLGYPVRANTVLIQSNCNPEAIDALIRRAEDLGIRAIQFLDLVHYPNFPTNDPAKLEAMKSFWEGEFTSFAQFRRVFAAMYPKQDFTQLNIMFGVNFWKTVLPNGMAIMFKDSTVTPRDEGCYSCPVTCQEGRCLVRVATDGNLTACPDYRGERYHFSVPEALNDGSLDAKMAPIVNAFQTAERVKSIELFAQKHRLRLPEEI